MVEVIQQLINALSTGIEYALVALGLAVLFNVLGLVNFAYGELITLTGYAMLGAHSLGVPTLLLPLVGIAAAAAASWTMDRIAFRPVRHASGTTLLITSFAVALLIQTALTIFVSPRSLSVPTPTWLTDSVRVGSLSIPVVTMMEAAVGGAALIALRIILKRTTFGTSMRAAFLDFEAVRLMGIRANRVISGAFVLSGLLAGVAGVFIISRRGAVDPRMGFTPLLFGFVAAVLGGLGSLGGAVIGGLLLGAASVSIGAFLPDSVSVFSDAILFLSVGLVLLFRPQGLFGRPELLDAH